MIGCGGYVDNNENIVESSDAERDSIFYQNKELTQFDVDAYQYFKKYERDYADMISFRKDLPGRVILIIDEGSPITPWDILDFKIKEDGSLEFEIVEKNKNGEIKLNEGDILIGWVDRFYIRSGRDLPQQYIRWVNFLAKVTSVISDRDKKVLLVYTEPKNVDYVIDSISLENIYLDWADIIEAANSPQAPKFNLVRVSSPLEAKSFEGKKRILLKFTRLYDCLNYIANTRPKFFALPNFALPFEFKLSKARGEIAVTIGNTTESWGSLENVPVSMGGLRGYFEIPIKPIQETFSDKGTYKYGGLQGVFRVDAEGMIKFLWGRRECIARTIELAGIINKSFYSALVGTPSGEWDARSYIVNSDHIGPEDFFAYLKEFSFKEEYFGWGLDAYINFKIGWEGSGAYFSGSLSKSVPYLKKIPVMKVERVSKKNILTVSIVVPFLYVDITSYTGAGIGLGLEGNLNINFNYRLRSAVSKSQEVTIGREYLHRPIGSLPKVENRSCNNLKEMIDIRNFTQLKNQIESMWGFKTYRCREDILPTNNSNPTSGRIFVKGEVKGIAGLYHGKDATINLGIPYIFTRIGVGGGFGIFLGGVLKGGIDYNEFIEVQLFPNPKIERLLPPGNYIAGFLGAYFFGWLPVFTLEVTGKKLLDMRLRLLNRLKEIVIMAANSSGYAIHLPNKTIKGGNIGYWDYISEIQEEARVLFWNIIDEFKIKL
jgi:hypothetical protein